MTPNRQQIAEEALVKARQGQSWANYDAIFEGFIEKGIPEEDILPRENVLTFNAWLALGRVVRKGEHGIKVVTFIPMNLKDAATGEDKFIGRKPRTTTVFHISQTEEISK